MKNKTYKNSSEHGFTLIELMTVVAIIGILAGVILVSTSGATERSKKASALTSASSVLMELVTCQDDDYEPSAPSEGSLICSCTDCGHSATWPAVYAKTGWSYATHTGTLDAGNYQFKLTKTIGEETDTITCTYAANECN